MDTHRRPRRLSIARSTQVLWVVMASLTSGCLSPLRTEEGASHVEEYQGVRIVEIMANPVQGKAGAFVEIRNDGEAPVSLASWGIRFGATGAPAALEPRQVAESAEAARNQDPSQVPSHGLALVIDQNMAPAEIARVACEAPLAAVPNDLPPAGTSAAAKKDRKNLIGTLQLQRLRHCIPVFTINDAQGLGERIFRSDDVSLMEGTTRRDRAKGGWADATRGVSFERRGLGDNDFAASPLGATPGARNFYGSDPYALAGTGRRPPIEVHSASPWRSGDRIQTQRHEAYAKLAAAESASGPDAERLRAEADELFGTIRRSLCEEFEGAPDANRCKAELSQTLPANPLVGDFTSFVDMAHESIAGSFYQINQHDVIDSLVNAAGRGVHARLSTDAGFENDPHYLPGFGRFYQAGIGLAFDTAYDIAPGDRVELAFEIVTKTDKIDRNGHVVTEPGAKFEFVREHIAAFTGSWDQPQMGVGERRTLAQLGVAFAPETRVAERDVIQTNQTGHANSVPAGCTADLDHVWVTYDGHLMSDSESVHGYKRARVRDLTPGNEFEVPRAIDPMANSFDSDRGPLSHNKFLVVDGEWLWTGSFNPIEDETSSIHADQAVTLHSTALAALHLTEAQTLFSGPSGELGGGLPGILKRNADQGVGGGEAWVDGADIDIRFSPGLSPDQVTHRTEALDAGENACDIRVASTGAYELGERYRHLDPCGGPVDILTAEVARAQSSIYLGLFSFALPTVTDVLLERLNAGVDIRGIGDQTLASRGPLKQLNEAGADMRFTPNSDPTIPGTHTGECGITPKRFCPTNVNKVWFHHKFLVIDYGTDHPVVITGSHNMSSSAEDTNDETMVIIRDRAVAEAYYRIFRQAYDHPQAIGPNRRDGDLPALAITEVRGSTEANGPQWAEITNIGSTPASLNGLELWNRLSTVTFEDTGLSLEPGQRAVLVVGDDAALGLPNDVLVIGTTPDADRAFIGPATALVLESADGRWISTYDPYTSAQYLPAGVEPAAAGAAIEWNGFGSQELSALTLELLGHRNESADTDRFSWTIWQPRGMFSQWPEGYDVTPSGLVLMQGVSSAWTPSTDPSGSPGRAPATSASAN